MAGGIKGITVKIGGDTTELGRSLKEATTHTKQLQTELKGVNTLLKLDPSNVTLLKQKQDLLKKSIEETENKQKALNEVLRQVESGEIEMTEAEYRNLQREIASTDNKLKALNNELREFGSVGAQQVAQVGEKLKGTGEKLEATGKKFLPVTGAIGAIGTIAVKTTADFDSSMSKVSAISGATGNDLQALRDKAREMGSQTKFSASESADAMSYMAMAGWKTEDMLSGISGVMDLAAASGEDLATTSDILTDGLTAFGLAASDSSRMADVMAAASSNANTNVSLLGESYKYCASTAGAMGFSLEDITESLGLMANAGVKGSQAGTTLKNAMINLAKPTDAMAGVMDKYGISLTNTDGSMKSWNEVVNNLRDSLGGLSEAEQTSAVATLFGKEATAGMLSVINAAPADIEKLNSAINNSTGSAKTMADTMNNNLSGQLTILKSQLQELAISFGEVLMPVIRNIVTAVQGFVDKLNGMSDKQKTVITIIAGVVASIGPLLIVIGKVCSSIGSILMLAPKIVSGFKMIKTAFTALGTAFSANPIGIVIVALTALVGGLIYAYNHSEKFRDIVNNAFAKVKEVVGKVVDSLVTFFTQTIPNAFTTLKDKVTPILEGIKTVFSTIWNAIKTVVSTVVNAIKTIITVVFAIILNIIVPIINGYLTLFKTVFNAIKTVVTTVVNAIKNVITTVFNAIKNFITPIVNGIKTVITTVWTAIKTATSTAWNFIKTAISTPINAVKSTVSSVVNSIKSIVSNVWNSIKSTTSSVWNGIKSAIMNPINSAKSAFTSAINTMKNALRFNWSLPKLKLPHISVSGGVAPFGIGGKGSLPKFNIAWYKDGAIFKKPTIFSTPLGFKGVGEAGAEAVAPISELIGYVSNAVNNSEIVDRIARVESVLTEYLPGIASGKQIVLDTGTLVGETIDKIDSALATNQTLRARGV